MYDAILVIVDRYSKMVIFVPTTKKITSSDLVDVLVDEVVRHYGMPAGIVSDRGSVFTSQFWSDFCYESHVKRRLSTAFHPQTDGQTERANQTLKTYLRMYCSEEQDNWASLLSQAEFACNNSVHAVLGMSPFKVLYGFDPELATRTREARGELTREEVPAAAEAAERLKRNHETLSERWRRAAEAQAKHFNDKHTAKQYNVGDLVMLSTKNLKLKVPTKKFAGKYAGPFKVIDAVGKQAYRLAFPANTLIHNVFHVSYLEPYKGREGEEHEGSLPLADEEGQYVVEKILQTRKRKGVRQYLVKWQGWPEEFNQWESEEHVEECEALDEFEEQQRSMREERKTRRKKR